MFYTKYFLLFVEFAQLVFKDRLKKTNFEWNLLPSNRL